jgi:lysyl-tRNA synthetase class 2
LTDFEEKKTMYNVFKKLLDIGDFIVCNYFQNAVGEISVHIYGFDGRQSLETRFRCKKTDADGKTYDAFADAEQRYCRRYVDLTVSSLLKRIKNVQRHAFFL